MKLAKAVLIAILVFGAVGCGEKANKDEPQQNVVDLEIVTPSE